MPSQHKHSPIPFRPAEGDRARLLDYAEQAGLPVNRVLSEALTAFLDAEDMMNCPGCQFIPPRHDGKCQYRGLNAAEIRKAMR